MRSLIAVLALMPSFAQALSLPVPNPCVLNSCIPPRPRPLPWPTPNPKPWDDESLNNLFTGSVSKAKGSDGEAVSSGSGGAVDAGERAPFVRLVPNDGRKIGSREVPYGLMNYAPEARIIKVGDTDANPLRYDNAQREAGVWGSVGAGGGALTGGVTAAVVGGVSGAIAGGLSGYASDLKEKQDADAKSYQAGNEARARDQKRKP